MIAIERLLRYAYCSHPGVTTASDEEQTPGVGPSGGRVSGRAATSMFTSGCRL
jgi:hypothetical protein